MSTLNNYKNVKTTPSNREHPVLILGAGLNGLTAAYELKKIGAQPVILDASGQGDTVIFTNGSTIRPDAVICATGYRPGLERLVGHLGVLDDTGHPTHPGDIAHPVHKGLWFMGMTPQLPGVFYAARGEAKRLIRGVQRFIEPRTVRFTRRAFSSATV